MTTLPPGRPRQTEAETRAQLAKHGVTDAVALLGVRGYYSETFAPAGNNRGVYDDAIFVVGPNVHAAFNANTDPSAWRAGIASLIHNKVHRYRPGLHGISRKPPYVPYRALRPATPGERLPVMRDGQARPSEGVAINIHRGGRNGTGSLGCQTIPPDQYDAFIRLVYAELERAGQKTVPYLLVSAPA